MGFRRDEEKGQLMGTVTSGLIFLGSIAGALTLLALILEYGKKLHDAKIDGEHQILNRSE